MEFPTGAIPFIENQWSHREFVQAVEPDYALTKITTARQLLKRDETADSYFGEGTQVITTTTVEDTKLNLLSWEDELEYVQEFDPAYHLPCDYSTYLNADQEERTENVSSYLEGTLTMDRWLSEADCDTRVIPLIKGATDHERARAIETLEPYHFPGYAFYGTQYFTSGEGILIDDLVEDVTATTEEHDRPTLLIGCLSPNYLERMPPQVVAGSGVQRWRMRVKPQKQSPDTMKAEWNGLREDVRDVLASSLTDDQAAETLTETETRPSQPSDSQTELATWRTADTPDSTSETGE
jgi:hypothetical protein